MSGLAIAIFLTSGRARSARLADRTTRVAWTASTSDPIAYGRTESALDVPLLGKFLHERLVRRQKKVERRARLDLLGELARRAERDLDVLARVVRGNPSTTIGQDGLEVARRGDHQGGRRGNVGRGLLRSSSNRRRGPGARRGDDRTHVVGRGGGATVSIVQGDGAAERTL